MHKAAFSGVVKLPRWFCLPFSQTSAVYLPDLCRRTPLKPVSLLLEDGTSSSPSAAAAANDLSAMANT